MGGLCAVLGEPGDPALAERLDRMLARSPYRGESVRHLEGGLAVGVQSLGWDASLHSSGNWLVAFHGWIGNWHELAPAHGLDLPDDASNALRTAIAYETLGDDLFAGLRGEFALLLVDRHRSELLAVRDVVGTRPVFHTVADGRRYLASEIRQVLAGSDAPARIDEGTVLDRLLQLHRVVDNTFYRGVRRTLPATVRRFALLNTGPGECSPYWRPPVHHAVWGTVEDAAAELRTRLERAVRRALPGQPFGVTLSGGVDGTAVWALAIAVEPGVPTLGRPVSLVFPGRSYDESDLIRASLEGFGADGLLIDADGELVDHLNSATELVDGLIGGWIHQTATLFKAVADDGRRVLLASDGGDEWLTGSADYLEDLASSGRLLRLASEIRRVAPRAADTGRLLWRRAAKPLVRRILSLDRRRSCFPSWLGRSWRAEARARLTEPDHPFDEAEPSSARSARLYYLRLWQSGSITEVDEQCAARFGIEQRYPLMDTDLIEFGFITEPSLLVAGQRHKHLFRRSVEELFPTTVRDRFRKSSHLELAVRSGRRAADSERPEDWRLAELGLLDVQSVDNLVRSARLKGESAYAQFYKLVELERFVASLERR
jgi:asparagine synthase (glutamine-hydrolysing)